VALSGHLIIDRDRLEAKLETIVLRLNVRCFELLLLLAEAVRGGSMVVSHEAIASELKWSNWTKGSVYDAVRELRQSMEISYRGEIEPKELMANAPRQGYYLKVPLERITIL
jgi:hypothetical protein